MDREDEGGRRAASVRETPAAAQPCAPEADQLARLSQRRVSSVVWAALLANLAIAVSKYVAAAVTGSSALLSEAIHSTADTGNELLLVLGSRLSRKPADRLHPFGRGHEIYFWGLIVALMLFALGGGLSLYEGIQHVLDPHPLENPAWNYIVLGCALLFEGASFAIAFRRMRASARKHGVSFLAAAHASKNPEHFVVLFEDASAIVGLLVAFMGVYASHVLEMPVLDGVASIIIGLILALAALVLAYECRSLLLGESAEPAKLDDIRALAARDSAVERVGQALTMYLGPDEMLLNLEVRFKDGLTSEEVEASIQRTERAIRARHRDVQRIFIEANALVRCRTPSSTPEQH